MAPPYKGSRSGFTLVELLVAIAVLAVIVAAVAQIVGTASKLTTLNNKHIDANSQARAVFDRMAIDFARMVKRSDVDYIFFKPVGTGGKGANDVMFFYTEGSSYFDTTTFPTTLSGYSATGPEKNSVSLVGYRINNGTELATPSTSGPTYYQMERLGEALSWDGYSSINPVVYLTYPAAGTDAAGVDNDNPPNAYYSTAYFDSTLYGAYSGGGGGPSSIVGTLANNFNDGTDDTNSGTANPYRPVGPQVFRFEYAFQLKDGTLAAIPVMTPSTANGIPSANLSASAPPTSATDSTVTASTPNTVTNYTVGSRWYDTADQIGYICVDATPAAAQWREIGIKDVAAVVVNLAVIDQQGLVFAKNSNIDLAKLAGAFADITDGPSANNVITTWTTAITPPGVGANSPAATASGIPQTMISQIRIYQRFFYVNNL